MRKLCNLISGILYEEFKNIYLKYIEETVDSRWSVCFISKGEQENTITYNIYIPGSSKPDRRKTVVSKSIPQEIRKSCGELMLLRFGLPNIDEKPYTCFLFIEPSSIKILGYQAIRLLKEWPGGSLVGEVKVAEYKIL
jgi:hypothetical protein